ncbi:MAG: dTDP-4-dehydrorhamnose 3,5-epimerase family protein [Candidatus Woesearchaeota archaeon]
MQNIEGVEVKKLNLFKDNRGSVMEILRSDDAIFEKFGQVYITTCKPGIAKAWHYHIGQSESFTCVKGVLKLVLYDGRKNSKTYGSIQEFRISLENPILVKIPAFVLHGFECGTNEELIAISIKTEPYNPKNPDKVKVAFNDPSIPYKWESKEGG